MVRNFYKADDIDRGEPLEYQEEDFEGGGRQIRHLREARVPRRAGLSIVRCTGGWRQLGVWRRILIPALVCPLRAPSCLFPEPKHGEPSFLSKHGSKIPNPTYHRRNVQDSGFGRLTVRHVTHISTLRTVVF